MKKPTTTIEKPAPKSKTEQAVVAVASEAKTKKPSPTPKTPKQPPAATSKPVSKAKTEPPVAVVAAEVNPKKPSPAPKSPKKSQVINTPKPVVTITEIAPSERVGLTAGSIWHYLAENGVSSVAKMVRELPEEEKTIQRGIGWLALEGKITLGTIDRVETIGLTV